MSGYVDKVGMEDRRGEGGEGRCEYGCTAVGVGEKVEMEFSGS